MAGLAETSLEVLVGLRPPGPVTAELVYGDQPTTAGRQTVDDWVTDGPAVSAMVTFGPVDLPVTFDSVRLYHAGEPLLDLPRTSALRLDPGDSFTEEIHIGGTAA